MKTILVSIIGLLMVGVASATMIENHPAIAMNCEGTNVAFGANAVCVDGQNIRPFTLMQEVCVRWDNDEEHNCVGTKLVACQTPINGTEDVCVGWSDEDGCIRTESRSTQKSLAYRSNIYKSNDESQVLVGHNTYTIPACAK